MRFTIAFTLLCLAVSGCAHHQAETGSRDYQTIGKDARRDSDAARADNAKALAAMNKGDDAAAETALKRALAADIMFGPAHNNLGKIYYKQNKLYLAAWEFEYASKLMPHQAEPRNNIGLVFEAAGKWSDAIDQYNQALLIEPDNPAIIGNAARAHCRRGDTDAESRGLLSKLVMLDTRPEWVDWARRRLAMMPPSSPLSKPAR